MAAEVSTDVLVVGAGGAGMYAAISAARNGADVVLVDKSLIGRGGATIMAQMTVAAAVGEQEQDHWTHHLRDTLEAGRGLCNEELAAVLCEEAPVRIREMEEWKVGWAREGNYLKQVMAPGHQVERCVYVDFLNTGPAVAKTLRTQLGRADNLRRAGELTVTDIILDGDQVVGAVGLDVETGEPVRIEANAVILAAGGLTRLYQRNSASVNMGGDSYALALRAGAELIDMEFVQFFPIGHLAPRMVGMDPIMWDPFRYKLGGRLLNADGEEFVQNYGHAETTDKYTAPRDVVSFAILQEVAAGRGSPAGGAFLSFQHIPEDELRSAFGPVIDRLADNGIDLTERSIEVAPIAHYHMGGIKVDINGRTSVEGLWACGECSSTGAHGANRLASNSLLEAFVFSKRIADQINSEPAKKSHNLINIENYIPKEKTISKIRAKKYIWQLRSTMNKFVGVERNKSTLDQAFIEFFRIERETKRLSAKLKDMLLVSKLITFAAMQRKESRGTHFRSDYPYKDKKLLKRNVFNQNDLFDYLDKKFKKAI